MYITSIPCLGFGMGKILFFNKPASTARGVFLGAIPGFEPWSVGTTTTSHTTELLLSSRNMGSLFHKVDTVASSTFMLWFLTLLGVYRYAGRRVGILSYGKTFITLMGKCSFYEFHE
jgi:hypothetical protein